MTIRQSLWSIELQHSDIAPVGTGCGATSTLVLHGAIAAQFIEACYGWEPLWVSVTTAASQYLVK